MSPEAITFCAVGGGAIVLCALLWRAVDAIAAYLRAETQRYQRLNNLADSQSAISAGDSASIHTGANT